MRQLLRPQESAGLQIHREDSVTVLAGRVGILVASADIEGLALHIDGWRAPDAAAGRSIEIGSRLALSGKSRRFPNAVRFPDLFAVARVQSYDAAAEFTALVFRIFRDDF